MSCYPAHRPVYVYILWSPHPAKYAGVTPLPVVVGPFKTKTAAQNALAQDTPNGLPDGVYSRVQQVLPFYTTKGHLGSLHFDQFIDPKTVVRAPTKPKTDKPVESHDTTEREGEDQDGGSSDRPEDTVHLVPG